jgi:hypothetical protein
MFRFLVAFFLIFGVGCSKKSNENVVKNSPAPQVSNTQTETVAQPTTESKTESTTETKTKPKTEPVPTPVKPEQAEPEIKVQVKEVAKPAGQFKTMEFSGNTRPLANGGTSQVYKLSDISRLKLLGVRFELNPSKVPLDHIISFTYAGRFDVHLTTDTGLRKICGEGFAETPVHVKGRKPGRPLEITFPRLLL